MSQHRAARKMFFTLRDSFGGFRVISRHKSATDSHALWSDERYGL